MRNVRALLVGAIFSAVAVVGAYAFNVGHRVHTEASTVIVAVEGQGHGSGVYVGAGQIVTAAHVAKMATDGKMKITNSSGSVASATVLWFDEVSDVGLLKLDAPFVDVKAAKLACETPDVKVGDHIEVIGAPLNMTWIHTWGRVAGKVASRESAGDSKQENFIADITIAPGNSGGPAFTDNGNVAGIASAIAVAPLGTFVVSLVPLAYFVPKSVICASMHEHRMDETFNNLAKTLSN